jgi:hypothetical protein
LRLPYESDSGPSDDFQNVPHRSSPYVQEEHRVHNAHSSASHQNRSTAHFDYNLFECSCVFYQDFNH